MDHNESIILGRVLCLSNNKIHQNQECYAIIGICSTLKATHYKDPPKILEGVYETTNNE